MNRVENRKYLLHHHKNNNQFKFLFHWITRQCTILLDPWLTSDLDRVHVYSSYIRGNRHASELITLDRKYLLHHHKNNNQYKDLIPLDYKTVHYFHTPWTYLWLGQSTCIFLLHKGNRHASECITRHREYLLRHHKNNNQFKDLIPLDYKTVHYFHTPWTYLWLGQ